MKDSNDCIIYVGKAKNLKKRVQTYFQNSNTHSPKVERLIKNIKDFDIIQTDTEFEAFLLECNLIQEFKPHYNQKMKNPLSYTYIEVQLHQEYPRIVTISNPVITDTNLYFGPYSSKNTAERAINGIKDLYKINCGNPSKMNSACLNHSLGLCIGMCLGGTAIKQYNTIIDTIIALLNGTDHSILEKIQQRMIKASERFDFEKAAKYRDLIELIHYLLNRKKVIEFTESNQNIAITEHLLDGTLKLFLIKGSKVLFREKLSLTSASSGQINAMIKSTILAYFDPNERNSSILINRFEIDEAQIIYSYLKGSNCSYIIIPEKWLEFENHVNLDDAVNQILCNYKEMPSNV